MGARKLRWVVIAIVGLALAGAVAWLFRPRPVSVEVADAKFAPVAETVADQGAARVREAYVVAAPVSGRLERIAMHVGDRVLAGRTVVARIRPASADLLDPRTRAQAQASLEAAEAAVGAAASQRDRLTAELRKAEADLARVRALNERGFAARQALEAAEAQVRSLTAAARAADADIKVQRARAQAARSALLGPEAEGGAAVAVTAPASGYVTRVLQESERMVLMGAPLVEVSDASGLEAAVEFLTQDAVRIREGMAAEVYDWGGPGALPAIVRRVEPQAFTKMSALGVEEQRVLVLLQFTGPPDTYARLGPGYRLWGRVYLRREPKALTVPVGALVRADSGWAVFRMAGGRARLTRVDVGAIGDRAAEVRRGLSAGAQVIVFPSDRVEDGVAVRPR